MKPDGEHSIQFSKQFAQEFKSSTPATASKQNSESRLFERLGQIAPSWEVWFRPLSSGTISTIREFIRGISMSSVTVELELPQDWKRFQMPLALKARLNSLLVEQDKTGKLSKSTT